ncbi:hypothetical protein [Pseudomonas syringae]|uniref:hypothetical protein n=1 Tax=Pseudomonas syringae TaxID=317 RepID=UPI001F0E8ED1|nr:hypothetical protein [Pseudomonas syringae]MCH5488897.1 hypothetical protein [Pseudomonas syringae pv. syringae]MDO1459897.1 hypothetical protein [Pseudomonas syringae pv. syringae]
MTSSSDFSISWVAPIVPSVSLAGIPLDISAEVLERVLLKYLVDASSLLYKFENSPDLLLRTHGLDELGNGGYSFSLFNDAIINNLLKGTPALSIMVRAGKVYAVKVYDFSFSGEFAREFVYKGVLPAGIGLGSLVSDLLSFTSLEFDSAEEWFYTDQSYGGLEVTGWGVPLEDHPDQVVTALCVISGAIA